VSNGCYSAHFPWRLIILKTIITLFFIFISYLLYSFIYNPLSYTPHTWYGYAFGILASVLVVLSTTYYIRKRSLKIFWMPLNLWYSWHLHLGWIALFFSLYHSNYKVRGTIPTTLFISLLSIIVSGYLFILIWKILGYEWKDRERIEQDNLNLKFLTISSFIHFSLTIFFFILLILHVSFSLSRGFIS
jgi:hypothetical protein